MNGASDKGPIFAHEEDRPDKVLRDLVLDMVAEEFAVAADNMGGPLMGELSRTMGCGEKGAEQVRSFIRHMAAGCWSVVGDGGQAMESALVILRESRKLIGGR